MSMGRDYVSELRSLTGPIVHLPGDTWAWWTMMELYREGKLIAYINFFISIITRKIKYYLLLKLLLNIKNCY
jgi:hypothetical protein